MFHANKSTENRRRALFVITLFLATAVAPVTVGQSEEAVAVIGEYRRLGFDHDLTAEHAEPEGDGYDVTAPSLSTQLRLDAAWLEAELGDWASDSPFQSSGTAEIRFDTAAVRVEPFVLSDETAFTFGSTESVRFVDRPMWLSATEEQNGLRIEMSDGDATGQAIEINRMWLQAHDLYPVEIQHEDGSLLDATTTGDVVRFFMPHFSFVTLSPAEIDVRGKEGQIWTTPYLPSPRWDDAEKRLEIDVGHHVNDFEVWVEQAWVDARMPHLGLRGHSWTTGVHDGKSFYVVGLDPSETPTTLVFEEFYPTAVPTFTVGHPESISLWAANASTLDQYRPVFISFDGSTNISIDDSAINRVVVNRTWLAATGLGSPQFQTADGPPLQYISHDGEGWIIETIGQTTLEVISDYLGPVLREELMQVAHLRFEPDTQQVLVRDMALYDWLEHGFSISLANLSWEEDYWGSGNLTNISLTADGEIVATVSPRLAPSYDPLEPPHFMPDPKIRVPFIPTIGPDTVFGLIFRDGAGSPISMDIGHLVSTELDEAGVFSQIAESCDQNQGYGSVITVRHEMTHWKAHDDDHTHPDADAFQDTAFIAQPEDLSDFAWRPVVDVSTCPGFANARTVTVETFAGFGLGGNSRWLSNAQQDFGHGFPFRGGDVPYAEYASGEYYDPGHVDAGRPYFHVTEPDGGTHVFNGADDGRQATLSCSVQWGQHLAQIVLTTLISLFGPEGVIAAVLINAAVPPAKTCEIDELGDRLTNSDAGTPGGGPWFNDEDIHPLSHNSVWHLAAEADWNPTATVLQGTTYLEAEGGILIDPDLIACKTCAPATNPVFTAYWTQKGPAEAAVTLGNSP